MSITTSNKARIAAFGVIALATGSIGTLLASESANAIPTPQRSCANDTVSATPGSGDVAVNPAVTIKNGKVARKVVVNFTADAYTSDGNTIRLAWKVGKSGMKIVGAEHFATHTQYRQTRHTMVVLDVPKGTHRIQPYWRVTGPDSGRGVIGGRCLTAEAYTS